ncbi:unnamed protein product [Paramecium sonneborni]|uniref:Uncharacterized protein n=1 Tax=Paramecium sonneborni TaxID=65129 RepID=A0A8S1QMV0_9CILI|nr:unnamed protein product [Paramecium sonneborni]
MNEQEPKNQHRITVFTSVEKYLKDLVTEVHIEKSKIKEEKTQKNKLVLYIVLLTAKNSNAFHLVIQIVQLT